MRGSLEHLYRAELVEGPSGPRDSVLGTLGVFSYGGTGKTGALCLFKPDDSEALGGREKLRPGPGNAKRDGVFLRFTVGSGERSQMNGLANAPGGGSANASGSGTYTWKTIGAEISDPDKTQEYLAFAETSDRIIRHLLEGARLDVWPSEDD